MWRSRKSTFLKMEEEEKLFEHVCQVMDMIIQTGRSLTEANLMTDPCVES